MALLLALIAAITFFTATRLVETTLGTSRTLHQFSVVIAAGVLLGITFVDLLPEAFELLEARNAALSIGAGFLLLYLVETLTSGHTHHHEPHAHGQPHAHSHAPEPDADGCVPHHAVLPFLIGLGVHNLADGIVIGASYEVSETTATGVTLGILIHQLPVGLSFGAVLIASRLAGRSVRRDALVVASLIPIGTLLVLVTPGIAGQALGALIGGAAGAILYIASGHLLPEAHSEERRPSIAAAFTTALLVTVVLVAAAGH